ncbi:MAG: hypothetical protein QW222_06610 [Candidatus Bathyarchaeia archaeon]
MPCFNPGYGFGWSQLLSYSPEAQQSSSTLPPTPIPVPSPTPIPIPTPKPGIPSHPSVEVELDSTTGFDITDMGKYV